MVKKTVGNIQKGLSFVARSGRRKGGSSITGFTLLELLIVVAITSVLIAVAFFSYSTIQKKARDEKRIGDLKAIQQALEQYYADNTKYPSAAYNDNSLSSYIPGECPKDPKSTCYYHQSITSISGYKICADLEGDGSFTCSIGSCSGVSGTGCTDDYCITNLQ